MKTLTLIILTLFIVSCEKEPINYSGTYKGYMSYDMPGIQQTTMARRIFSDIGNGNTQIHIWDAPNIDDTTVIENNTYQIGYTIADTTYCFNSMQIKHLSLVGVGKFIGDSLFKSGIVTNRTNIGTVFEIEVTGTWSGKFCFDKRATRKINRSTFEIKPSRLW